MRDDERKGGTTGGTKGGTGAGAPRPRGRDEYDFLDSRQNAPAMNRGDARRLHDSIISNARVGDRTAGLVAHTQGSALNAFYGGHGDAVLEYASFDEFLENRWPLDPSVGRERMRIAKTFTEDECSELGATVCMLGVRLLGATGLPSIEKLRTVDLRLLEKDGGGTVRFPAPVSRLRAALRFLKTPPLDDDTEPGFVKLQRARRHIAGLCADNEAYAELNPRASLADDDVAVAVRAVGRAQLAAASSFYADLAKKR